KRSRRRHSPPTAPRFTCEPSIGSLAPGNHLDTVPRYASRRIRRLVIRRRAPLFVGAAPRPAPDAMREEPGAGRGPIRRAAVRGASPATGEGRGMAIIVTGCAGFIGFHVSLALLERGEQVGGVDDLNAYYDPALNRARLERLEQRPGFAFARLDVADRDGITDLARRHRDAVTGVVHLAAQAGVRHSLKAPFDYVHSNLEGHMAVLEACRHELPKLGH